ncbi:hypothetical protein [uncultured Eubacterium sp.]|uniref:hypothetical protein n=1 Tax=uncultured Eubacterium sp. TaxID=165185 RepID=UPI0025EA3060|nr:hypothetical protein [uncultured Eubacterium sp.]
MKKLISVLLSIMMIVAVGAMSVVPAIAANSSNITVGSGDQTFTASGAVNGQLTTSDVTIKVSDSDSYEVRFDYVGKEEFLRWEIIGLEEGEYTIVKKEGTTLIIKVNPSVAEAKREFTANAITKKSANSGSTTKPSTGNTDKSGTSPSTGASVAGVAVAGAGVALLTALKKKD